ncbi:MAG: ABC transporter permease subunit [Eubacteriales bacterium]
MNVLRKWRVVPVTLYLLAFLVVPLINFFVYSFKIAENESVTRTVSLSNYARIFSQSLYLSIVLQTIIIGLVVGAITVLLAFLFSYVITFHLPRLKDQMLLLTLISMLSSYLVRIYAWKSILGSTGVLNQFLQYIGIINEPLSIFLYNKFAIIITLVHILLPLSILPIYSAMQNIDKRVVEAARDLGSSGLQSFIKIIIPLSSQGIIASFIFVFILAAGDYVTPQLMGGNSGVMLGRVIYDQFAITFDWPFGSALSFFLLFVFLGIAGLFVLLKYLLPIIQKIRINPINRKPSDSMRSGAAQRWLFTVLKSIPWPQLYAFGIIAFLYIPLVLVIIFSFNEARAGIFPIEKLSFKWYEQTLTDPIFLISLKNSLWVGFITVAISVVLGLLGSLAITRDKLRWKKGFMFILSLPITLPGIIIGASLLSMFTSFNVKATVNTAIIGHVLFTVPFVILSLNARLNDFDRRIEEAGRDLGANLWQVFIKITLPNIAVSLIGAALLVLALSLDEFLITFFTIGSDSTLPILIWSMMRRGVSPSINVVATLMLVSSFLVMLTINMIDKNKKKIFS